MRKKFVPYPSDCETDDLALLVKTAWRRLPLLLLAGGLAGAAAYYLSLEMPERYRVEASLVIDARNSSIVDEQDVLALPEDGTLRAWLVRSEGEVVASTPVVRQAVRKLDADERAFLLDPESRQEMAIQETAPVDAPLTSVELKEYHRLVKISNDPNTFLIRIQATAPTAELAAKVANNHAAAYLELNVARKRAEADRILDAIRTELEQIDREMADNRDALGSLLKGGYASTTNPASVTAARLTQLYSQFAEAEQEVASDRLSIEIAEATGNFVALAGLGSPLAELRQRELDINQKIAAHSSPREQTTRFGFEQEHAIIAAALEAERTSLLSRKRAELEIKIRKAEALAAEVKRLEAEVSEGKLIARQLDSLNEDARELTLRKAALLAQRVQLITKRNLISPDGTLVQPALAPSEAYWPQPTLAAGLGGTLGAGLALAVALSTARNAPTPRPQSRELSFFGPLPHSILSTDQGLTLSEPEKALRQAALENLRLQVDLGLERLGASGVLVASAESEPEFPELAEQLAGCFSRAGHRTLLVTAAGERRASATKVREPHLLRSVSGQIRPELVDAQELLGASAHRNGMIDLRALKKSLAEFDRIVWEAPEGCDVVQGKILLEACEAALLVQHGNSGRPKAWFERAIPPGRVVGIAVVEPAPPSAIPLRGAAAGQG